jgi:hypothetical protein
MKNLSTIELNYISDILSWELLSCKKSYQYGSQETNPVHQKVFFDAANVHKQNYLSMLNYVNQVNNSMGGQIH